MEKKSKEGYRCCQEDVSKINLNELPEEVVTDLAAIFGAFGDTTRIRLIHALIQSEMCVCDLAKVLGMTQSAVSHQLRNLKNLRIVKRRKVGRSVYYRLDDHHILTLFQTGLEHVTHR